MLARPLVSVMMTAYDRPVLTGRALRSVVEQEYRPIEVVLADDGSPVSLEPVVNEFRMFEDAVLSIRYYRQATNVGYCDNIAFTFDQARGKYAVSLNNDDWFTNKRFLIEAVEVMERNPGCYLCAANSAIENSNGMTMITLPPGQAATDGYRVLHGDSYMKLFGEDGIGHQAYSAVVFNAPVARSLGVMRYPFNIPGWLAREVDILGDEGFALQYLLASVGSVAVSDKVVSVRGMPGQSYSKSEEWRDVGNQAMFIIYYNLYKARLRGRHAYAVRRRARDMLFLYAARRINFGILRHYRYEPAAVLFMVLSWALYHARYYGRSVRRMYRIVVKRDRGELHHVVAKIGERGLLATLLPFLFPSRSTAR